MIFRVRSAKAIKITDMDLIKRLGVIVGIFVLCLLIRTLVSPPVVIIGKDEKRLPRVLPLSLLFVSSHTYTVISFACSTRVEFRPLTTCTSACRSSRLSFASLRGDGETRK